jgi:hypothetical protein
MSVEHHYSQHAQVLIDVQARIVSLGNSIEPQIFLYEYARTVVHLGFLRQISRQELDRIILNTISTYQNQMGTANPINTEQEYYLWLKHMTLKFRYEFSRDMERYMLILNIQNALNEVDVSKWFDLSPQLVLANTYVLRPKLRTAERVTPVLGDYIFDNIHPSERLPYVVYNGRNDENYYKIYSGQDFGIEPDYNRLIVSSKRGNKEDTIEMTLWLGTGTIYRTSKESFFRVVYDLSKNEITYSVPVTLRGQKMNYKETAYKYLSQALSTIMDLGSPELIQSKVEISLYPLRNEVGEFDPRRGKIVVHDTMLLGAMMFDEFYRNIIFPDEVFIQYPRRSRSEYQYVSMFMRDFVTNESPITWSMTPRPTISGISYATTTGGFSDREGNHIKLKILDAKNQTSIDRMLDTLIPLLCVYYSDVSLNPNHVDRIYYSSFLGQEIFDLDEKRWNEKTLIKNKKEDAYGKMEINREGGARLKKYKREYPDVFNASYKPVCASHKTPEVFDTIEKAQEWYNRTGKKILKYPSDRNRFTKTIWVGCPHESYPYPTIVANKNPETNDEIPYFPCCSDVDHTTGTKSLDYREFYEGEERVFKPSAIDQNTDKFLDTNETAEVEVSIRTYLSEYSQDSRIVKRGVMNYPSPNSFLHCVLYAIKEPKYMELYPKGNIVGRRNLKESLRRREAYVEEVRRNLLKLVHSGVISQELYDLRSYDELQKRINDVKSFFDPFIYYRFIEEAYGVNVYSFNKSGYEIPRHREYSVRYLRMDRPTILIYKNKGPKISQYAEHTYPGCELIIDENSPKLYFGGAMTEKCHNVHTAMLSTITFVRNANSLSAYSNMYYFLDYKKIFGTSLIEQHIDGYGKTRALNILIPSGKITVFVPPGQPLSLPVSSTVYITNMEIAWSTIAKNGSRVTSATRDTDGMIDGFWFSVMDIQNCLYVKVTKQANVNKQIINLPVGPRYLDIERSASDVQIYREQERTVSIIKQVVRWAFDIIRSTIGDSATIATEFSTQLLRVTPQQQSPQTSVNYYNLRSLRKVFPKVSSYEECFNYLRTTTRNLVSVTEYAFTFHNKVFRDKLADYIRVYHKNSLGTVITPKDSLENYRSTYLSFNQFPGIEVFSSTREFKSWLSAKEMSKKDPGNKIYKQIDIDFSLRVNPYIYMANDGQIFLIQNIEGMSSDKAPADLQTISTQEDPLVIKKPEHLVAAAIKVLKSWRTSKINPGFYVTIDNADLRDLDHYKIVTYGISSSGHVIPIASPTASVGENYFSVLKYMSKNDAVDDTFKIAAMLPLV